MKDCDFNKLKGVVLSITNWEESLELDIKLRMIASELMSYCNREDMPIDEYFLYPLADAVISEINKRNSIGLDNVTSYNEGDLSISFGDTSTIGLYGGKLERFKLVRGAK